MSGEALTLFIFEGENPEVRLIESLESNGFLEKNGKKKCVFDADIYQLSKKLREDPTLDIVKLLKERRKENKQILDGLSERDFAYVYLFFDYDAHATNADDKRIEELLSLFCNETEHGMLYISYPMSEAIRHYKDMDSFKLLTVKCKRGNCPYLTCPDKAACLEEPHYKAVVNAYNPRLASAQPTVEIWRELITAHLCKMNHLVLDVFGMPSVLQSQMSIFEKQMEKHICQDCPHVTVLSAFPIFLLDYYGCEGIKKLL